jgi:hypothetical protein
MHAFVYVSYEDLKTYQGIASTTTADDVLLKALCQTASAMWDNTTRRHFAPRVETRYYDYDDAGDLGISARARLSLGLGGSVLKVDDDLLEVNTLTTGNGTVTVLPADILLKCGNGYNRMPYDRIELASNGTTTVFTFSGTAQKANAVTGIWGYHDAWSHAWLDSLDTVEGGGITASATSLTVNDADGADANGLTPRFKIQGLIKIGTEYLYVTARDTATNVLTVTRGVNGSTAAIHAADVSIYVYQPITDVVQMVKRLAAWMYGQKDSPFFEAQTNAQLGTVTIPAAVPVDVRVRAAYYTKPLPRPS